MIGEIVVELEGTHVLYYVCACPLFILRRTYYGNRKAKRQQKSRFERR